MPSFQTTETNLTSTLIQYILETIVFGFEFWNECPRTICLSIVTIVVVLMRVSSYCLSFVPRTLPYVEYLSRALNLE